MYNVDRNDPDFDRNNPGPRLVKHLESEIARLEDDFACLDFQYMEVSDWYERLKDVCDMDISDIVRLEYEEIDIEVLE